MAVIFIRIIGMYHLKKLYLDIEQSLIVMILGKKK